jgi:arsenate reductase-like glutaredoxin family protein
MAPERLLRTAARMRNLALFGLSACGTLAAMAQVPLPGIMFTCVANGKTYTADRPPAECVNSDIRELNRDGSVRRVIARPLTIEEQRARALEAKKKYEEEERILAQRRRDRSLLEAYATEAEIEAARKKSLEGAEQIIRRSQERAKSLAEDRKRLDDESEFYKKREQPDSLKRAYALNGQAVTAEEKIIAEARGEVARINERFDAEQKRFRELVAQGARPVQRNPEADILLDPRFSGRQ